MDSTASGVISSWVYNGKAFKSLQNYYELIFYVYHNVFLRFI